MTRSALGVPDDGRPGQKTVRLTSREEVSLIRDAVLRPHEPDLHFMLEPALFGSDAEAMTQRVNALYSDCGCEIGGAAVLLAMVSLAAWWVWSGTQLSLTIVVWALLVLVAAGLTGKGIGLIRSRVLLMRVLGRLEVDPAVSGRGKS